MVLSAVGFGIAAMAAATALSLSWVFIPGFLFFIGLPALVYGGITAGLFAGAASLLLMPTLLMAGGLWLGVRLAKNLFFVEEGEEQPSYGTVDIDAETVAKFDEEMREAEGRRAQELREFDEMLRRRERLKREGGY